MASWSDKETTTCEVKLTLDGEEVKAGTSLTDEGSLTLTVTDGSGESKSITVKLKALHYQAMPITHIRPIDILPIV